MLHGNVPIFDMWHAFQHHKNYGSWFWVFLSEFFKFLAMNLARRQIPLFANKKNWANVLQEVSTIVSEYEAQSVFFPFLLLAISKQQK